jgi:hypothetical protein
MNVLIERFIFEEEFTIGRWYFDGIYFCNTLEDKVRDLGLYGEGKIPEKTAIPAEKYKMIITYWPKYKLWTPSILNVQYFTGIRCHSGVNAKDTHGCVLTGIYNGGDKLEHSYNTFVDLMKRFDKNDDGTYKNTIYDLEIINKFT